MTFPLCWMSAGRLGEGTHVGGQVFWCLEGLHPSYPLLSGLQGPVFTHCCP